MSVKSDFVKFINSVLTENKVDFPTDELKEYWKLFQEGPSNEKPTFTENGILILRFLRDHPDQKLWKSKDLAEKMELSSRTVSGSMRKLVTDGFVEKVGQDPIIYSITEKGKEINLEN